MDKMRMESVDMTAQNIEKIGALFPNCITEKVDENGALKKSINFEMLRQILSEDVLDGDESYEFTWIGKKSAIVEANNPIRKTLRPCIDESKDWDDTENLYIEGDNLEVLKLLQESYLGTIKMIYIDPPYNTGNDFIYNDNFKINSEEYIEEIGQIDEDGNRMFKNIDSNGRFHSDWCSMIYSRLLLARNLLKADGCIFISISDIEVINLRKICDEIFGSSNFVADLIWANKEGGGSSDSKLFRIKHEHILCYAKDINNLEITGVPISNADRYKGSDKYVAERGPYYLQKLGMGSIQYSASLDYPIETPDGSTVMPADNNRGKKACWRWSRDKYEKNKERGFIEIKKDSQGIWTVYTKQYMNCDNDGNIIERTQRPMGIIEEYSSTQAAKMLENMGLGGLFNYSKPVDLMKYLLGRLDLEEEYVLDFFSGSASLAHAVMQMNAEDGKNRKYIMVQLPEKTEGKSEARRQGYETICDIGKKRIRQAADVIRNENHNNKFDGGYRVFKLADSNMNDVYYSPAEYSQNLLPMLESNVKSDRTDLDLLFGCLLEWGLPLSMPYSSAVIDGYTIHNYNDGDLIACFDKDVPDSVIKEIAKRQPLRAVFRDSSFANSPSKINVGEIFKLMAPDTRVKVI
ncbi:site-specific DNA-methyltransferase [Veillonella atypica]|jgi:site-specific DNA-methyltransferase (adenine-specific)|uniref:site-specific DNA-methyltransferase n=1 Tax=Veillonella atypica TaxID=39777 RepID=UPI0022E25853|nr:site-specific DNA-methyltransferase [Veillonella atypica]